jgi:voltage-gated potassium channel
MSRGMKIDNIEEFPRRIKIFLVIIVCLLFGGTMGFRIIDGGSIKDSFFRTLQTLAFMFQEVTTIPERSLEIFLAIVGVFLIWWILWSLADMFLEGNLGKYLKRRIYNARLMEKRDHIIIAGGGRVGKEVAKILDENKKKFVLIENDERTAEGLINKNYIVVIGNAEDDNILIQAGIKNAKKIIITLPKTEKNILITLSAKELNPNIEIHARAEDNKFVSKLKKAGAKIVVVPEIVAGNKLV